MMSKWDFDLIVAVNENKLTEKYLIDFVLGILVLLTNLLLLLTIPYFVIDKK